MKFKVKCWNEWGDPRGCGYNAYGNDDFIEVELEADFEHEVKSKLEENKILSKFGRNRFQVLSVKI